MHRTIILIYYAVYVSSFPLNSTEISLMSNITSNKNIHAVSNHSSESHKMQVESVHGKSADIRKENFKLDQNHNNKNAQNELPFLHKLRVRITRSKDAVWATITLTFMCVLLVLAVAQSRMWKDHYYSEAQGIPLPNFNERVLFKDVMERKVSSLKQFFKKKSKKKNVTELEALLPPSEWDI